MSRNFEERCGRHLAHLLWYGTWIAALIIAAGIVIGAPSCAKAGIALFILLPIARVALMLGMFARERDYAYAAIAAVVLAIIAAGVVAGIYRVAIHL